MEAITLARPHRQAADFDSALADYQRAHSEFDRLWALHSAAAEAWFCECPRQDEYFDEHKLGIGMSRERVIQRLQINAIIKGADPEDPAIATIADAFMAYQNRNADAKDRLGVDRLEDKASDYGEAEFFPARERLMATPAPDTAALLLKLEIAAVSTDGDHIESVLADARRLLEA